MLSSALHSTAHAFKPAEWNIPAPSAPLPNNMKAHETKVREGKARDHNMLSQTTVAFAPVWHAAYFPCASAQRLLTTQSDKLELSYSTHAPAPAVPLSVKPPPQLPPSCRRRRPLGLRLLLPLWLAGTRKLGPVLLHELVEAVRLATCPGAPLACRACDRSAWRLGGRHLGS